MGTAIFLTNGCNKQSRIGVVAKFSFIVFGRWLQFRSGIQHLNKSSALFHLVVTICVNSVMGVGCKFLLPFVVDFKFYLL